MKLRVTFALFAFLLLFTTFAQAQLSDGEKKAAARAAYLEGVDQQDKGKPADALGSFEKAQALFDAPTHLLHIAECQALTGKLVEASETYEVLSRKSLPPGSPDVFLQAQDQGKTELAGLRQRIPTMRVVIKPDPGTLQNLQININDKTMPKEMVGIARPVNPGTYKLSASATGYGTAAPVDVDVKEKEAKSAELTLVQGGSGTMTPTPIDPKTGAPEKPGPTEPVDGPSSTGLLVGVRPGYFIPVGEVANNIKFEQLASAGPGIGADVIGRLARIFLVGGSLEFAALGAPDAKFIPDKTQAKIATRMFYVGVLAGLLPNVDKVSFTADAGLGLRFLSRDQTLTLPAGNTVTTDESYNGLEVSLAAGVSIPAGPIRIVPKLGLALGQFTTRSCSLGGCSTAAGTTAAASAPTADLNSSFHSILNLVIGVYYHVDFSKKSNAARVTPMPLLPVATTNTASN